MLIQLIKGLLKIILNGVALHRVYGFSIHLFRALWNSLAHLLISIGNHPLRRNQYNQNAAPRQDTEIRELINPASAPTKMECPPAIPPREHNLYPDVPKSPNYFTPCG